MFLITAQKRHFLSQMVYQTEILPSGALTGLVLKIITVRRILTVLVTKKHVNLMFPQRVQGKKKFFNNLEFLGKFLTSSLLSTGQKTISSKIGQFFTSELNF